MGFLEFLNKIGKGHMLYCNKKHFEEHLEWGYEFYQHGAYKAAVRAFDRAISLRSNVPAVCYQLGLALARLGDMERAIDDFKKVVEMDSPLLTKRDAWYSIGKAYEELARYHEAIDYYDKAIRLDSNFANAYCNRGKAHTEVGESESSIAEFECALTDLDKAISLNPEDWIAYFNRAIVYNKLNKHDEVDRDLELFLRLAPPNHPYRELAEKDLSAGRQGGKSPKLSMLRQKEIGRLMTKIIELNNREKFQEAIEHCNIALEKEQLLDTIWGEKAFALCNIGARNNKPNIVSEALDCCNRGIKLNPRSARLWSTKGCSLAELGRYQEAIGAFQKFISIAPPEYEQVVEDAKASIQKLRSELGDERAD